MDGPIKSFLGTKENTIFLKDHRISKISSTKFLSTKSFAPSITLITFIAYEKMWILRNSMSLAFLVAVKIACVLTFFELGSSWAIIFSHGSFSPIRVHSISCIWVDILTNLSSLNCCDWFKIVSNTSLDLIKSTSPASNLYSQFSLNLGEICQRLDIIIIIIFFLEISFL